MEDADQREAPAAPVAALVRGAAVLGIALSNTAISRFQLYIETLLLWRSRLSLTTASTPEEIVASHILDSLSIYRFIEPGMRVADLGSGAGFPGIPLAIACERAQVSLVESRRKKANFLREVVRSCELGNAEVVEERAEHVVDRCAGRWNVVASRAVWPLRDFLVLSEPLLTHGGLAIAMKGPSERSGQTSYLGPLLQSEIVEYQLHSGARHLLLIYRKP